MKPPIPVLATEPSNGVLPLASEAQLLSRAAQLRAKPASQHNETGRTHGMPFIFWLLEQSKVLLVATPTVIAGLALGLSGFGLTPMGAIVFGATWIAVPIFGVILPLMYLVYRSHRADSGTANWGEFFAFKEPSEGKRW